MPALTDVDGNSELDPSELRTLVSISHHWWQETDLDRLVEQVTIAMVDLATARHGVLRILQNDQMEVVAEAKNGNGHTALVKPASGSAEARAIASPTDDEWQVQRPLVEDGRPRAVRRAAAIHIIATDLGPILCVPLVAPRRLIGSIHLKADLQSQTLPPNRLVLLELLASQAAILIDNLLLSQIARRAEQDARQARDEWRQEIDRIPVQIWRTDAKGVLEAANKQWHDFTGMTHEQAAGEEQQYRSTCHPDDTEKVFGLLSRLHESGVSGEVECRMLRYDGVYRRVLARAAPLHDETGSVIRWHGTTIDIEELKRAEEVQEALARISRVTALGELAVSIAHEVNQPLMSIVTNAATCLRWLASEAPNLPEARLAAERIVRDGHRAGHVIASIRELARKAPPKLVELDVNRVIDEVLALARNELERHGISVTTRLAAGNCVTLADRVQIQQVVLNLIVNGIEAMDGQDAASRVLVIATEEIDERFVEIAISDTGRGLDVVDAERVFDAFFTSKVGGIGMGLSICRSIVENHGGRMAVSPNQPQGCTFSFQLPAHAQEQPHAS